jgi:hypothetical protein
MLIFENCIQINSYTIKIMTDIEKIQQINHKTLKIIFINLKKKPNK